MQVFADNHAATLATLTQVLEGTRGNEEWGNARDNATAAIGKILVFQPAASAGDVGMRLGALWVNAMPLLHDDTEAAQQHGMLHDQLVKNDARVLGEGQANLVKIADVFVRVIGKGSELLKDEATPTFQEFFFKQLLPVLQEKGFALESAVTALGVQDQQRFLAAAKANGVGA